MRRALEGTGPHRQGAANRRREHPSCRPLPLRVRVSKDLLASPAFSLAEGDAR